MGKKGVKSQKGVSETGWGQKTFRFFAQVSDQAGVLLGEMIEELKLSRAEVLERLSRGMFHLKETKTIAELVTAKRQYLLKVTCFTESRLNELGSGAPITAQEIGKIAYALNLQISYLEELADVCGIVEPGAMPEKGNSEPDSANLPDQACSRD